MPMLWPPSGEIVPRPVSGRKPTSQEQLGCSETTDLHVIELDIQVLIHRGQCTLDHQIVLEFDRDGLQGLCEMHTRGV